MKQATWNDLNALAVRIHDLPDGSEALRLSLEGELFNGLFEVLNYDFERISDSGRPISTNQEQRLDALAEFWVKEWNAGKFDPQRGTFAQFFTMKTKFLKIDTFQKDRGGRRKRDKESLARREEGDSRTVWEYDVSLYTPLGPDGDGYLMDREETPGGEPSLRYEKDAALQEYLALALTIPDRLHGRSNTEVRRIFYRLFFTDGLSAVLRHTSEELELEPYQARERELLEASETDFLDYFLTAVCRTVPELAEGRLKRYGELVPDRPMDALETEDKPLWHLPADVYITYRSQRGKATSDSSVSAYWKDYQALCGTLLQKARNE